MAVIQWAPLRDLTTLQQQLDRLFDGYVPTAEYATKGFTPAAELLTTDRDILVNIELPGVDPATLDLQVSAQHLVISGERVAPEIEGVKSQRSEFTYGQFQRRISLPEKVQNDQTVAKYDGGVLRLVLPKLVDDQHKIVKVDIAI
jgi:HSP20 family protein